MPVFEFIKYGLFHLQILIIWTMIRIMEIITLEANTTENQG